MNLSLPVWLPIGFDYLAICTFAIAGALLAIEKSYDIVGVFTVAFCSAVGGGLIRDGIFLQQGPPLITLDGLYLVIIAGSVLFALFLYRFLNRYSFLNRLNYVIMHFDAMGVGAYAIVGMQKAEIVGLALPAIILVGIINAIGGGLLRDILIREEPWVFRPGQLYVLAVFIGCLVFVGLRALHSVSDLEAGVISVITTFTLRLLAIHFNWQTDAIKKVS